MGTALSPRLAVPPAASRTAAGAMAAAILVAAAVAGAGWAGALSILWLAIAAVAWRNASLGLVVVALAVPFEQRLSIPIVFGDLTSMEYTVGAVAVGSLPRLWWDNRLVLDRVATMHLAVVVALVASIGAGGVRLMTWWEVVAGWLLALLAYLIARAALADARSCVLVVSALAAGVMVNAGTALWQRATGAGPESFVVNGAVRVFGTFLHPNTLAAYLAFALPVLMALSLTARSPVVWFWRAATAAGVATLLLTQSRGGLLALGASVVVLLALAPRSVQRVVALGVVLAAVLLAAVGAVGQVPGIERFSSVVPASEPVQVTTETWGQLEREAHWGAAWSMLRSDPVFGVGAGEFNDAFREHTPEWRFRIGRGHAHNGYLQLGAEAGVPGVVAFAGWVGTILVALWRRMYRVTGIDHALAVGALGGAVAWAVNNVVEYQDVASIPIMFALTVAIGLGGARHIGSLPAAAEATGDAP